MPTPTTTSLPKLFYLLLISSIIFLFHGITISAQDDTTNIGAIIDVNSRIGKQEKLSMEIAVQNFNNKPNNKHKIVLYVSDSGGYPLQAASAADKLIKEKQVQAIIGMDTWKEAELVTEIATQAQVPTLSFSAPSITPPLTKVRWPFLVRRATNDSLQIQCIASIVGSYGWRKVIAIYEDGGYNTDSGSHTLLSNQLQAAGSEIEHWLAFPSFSTIPDPKDYINKELEKLTNSTQSRVFIIVGSSLELAIQILTGAKHNGLMASDSVWITTDCVTSQLDTLNSSVMSSMQGIIGIKTHFSKKNPSFINFSTKFRNIFRSHYREKEKSEPGIYALRAYDTISAILLATEKSSTNSTIFLQNILSSSFNGLIGKIQFKDGELSEFGINSTVYEIVNVVEGKACVPLKLWSPDCGFLDPTLNERNTSCGGVIGGHDESEPMQVLGKQVNWPGGLERPPLGWVMPSYSKRMVIGIPNNTLERFVKVKDYEKVRSGEEEPEGFCIDLFKEALELLNYHLPHRFEPFNDTYEKLVNQVYLKEFDAIVGDITILADRSNNVEFTQPYVESDLTMIVPVKKQQREWLFSRPFTGYMWLVLGIVFMYTMFVVWFLEHRNNPEFDKGSRKNQLYTAMWFTFSTLFFAHKERIRSNFTQVVLVAWLFVVFVVTASYEASLTSMLTVQRLEPTVTDIDTLRRGNATVGCDGDSFVWNYLQQVLLFNPNNIKNISTEYDYPNEFKSKSIQAAFLEQPYARVLSSDGSDYQAAGPTYRLGGFGFVFPKGSPMARDFSKAFLKLSENGFLNELDSKWFQKPSDECSSLQCATEYKSLSLRHFWSIFMVTGLTSAIMLIVYIACKKTRHPCVAPLSTTSQEVEIVMSTDEDFSSECNTPGHPQLPPVPEIEMSETYIESSDSQTRPLRLANSLTALHRPAFYHISRST